ncbi:MAG: Ig-like domain-containing protein [Myxococcota bacterium]|nr:Ig-like domain-containing protein [Myxococcota bacterium]
MGIPKQTLSACQPQQKVQSEMKYNFCNTKGRKFTNQRIISGLWSLWVTLVFSAFSACAPGAEPMEMFVVDTQPAAEGTLPIGQAIHIQFDQYLDERTTNASAVQLNTGDIQLSTKVGYDPVAKRLIVQPKFSLRPKIGYRIQIDHERLRGRLGERLSAPFEFSFLSADGARPEAVESSPRPTWLDVQQIFANRCGCHGPDENTYPPLLNRDMLSRPSVRQPEFAYVKPGAPLASYIVLRLLPNYPGVSGPTKMASPEEVRLIIDWISNLRR